MAPKYVEGAPYWVDLSTADVAAATAFYCELFGWKADDTGPESDHYTLLTHDGELVAAIGTMYPPDTTPQWMLYFKTESLWDRTKAIEAAGGLVRMPPADVSDQTSIAQFSDPAGARFSVSQPGTHTGADRWGDPGSVCWVELHVRQAEPAMSFYQRVFGWGSRAIPGRYPLLMTEGQADAFGGIEIDEDAGEPRWNIYFEVHDCDATAEHAVTLGGRLNGPVRSTPAVGRWADLTDPDGSRFRVLSRSR